MKYRRKIVAQNLKNSFPEKSQEELNSIEKKFYTNLCDITVEGIKGFSMSKKQLVRRYKVLNPEVEQSYFEKGQNTIGAGSHFCNWEWGVLCFSLQFTNSPVGIYKPLTNKFIDSYIRRTRAAWGMKLAPIRQTARTFIANQEKPTIFLMVSDQNPSNIEKAQWVNFLNQDTACLHGLEVYSKKYKLPILYGDVQRVKRGFYTVEMSVLEEEPHLLGEGEVTQKYMNYLEKVIRKTPENWLWSHKRWKHKR